MPGESSSETENPYGRMHVTEPVRATIPVQIGARLSWDRYMFVARNMMNKCAKFYGDSSKGKNVKFNLASAIELSEEADFVYNFV